MGITMLWTAVGCSSHDAPSGNSKAYYQFRGDDIPKLLPYKTNQVLLFRDQFDNERRIGFSQIDMDYQRSNSMGFSFLSLTPAIYFEYDEKTIQCIWQSGACASRFLIHFRRWPLNTQLAENNNYTEYPSAFSAYIDDFPYWNKNEPDSYSIAYIPIRYDQATMQLSCFNTTYTQVLKLVSNSNTPLPNAAPDVPRNVNVLYYDITQGIVGYDDLDGHQWRLFDTVSLKK